MKETGKIMKESYSKEEVIGMLMGAYDGYRAMITQATIPTIPNFFERVQAQGIVSELLARFEDTIPEDIRKDLEERLGEAGSNPTVRDKHMTP